MRPGSHSRCESSPSFFFLEREWSGENSQRKLDYSREGAEIRGRERNTGDFSLFPFNTALRISPRFYDQTNARKREQIDPKHQNPPSASLSPSPIFSLRCYASEVCRRTHSLLKMLNISQSAALSLFCNPGVGKTCPQVCSACKVFRPCRAPPCVLPRIHLPFLRF